MACPAAQESYGMYQDGQEVATTNCQLFIGRNASHVCLGKPLEDRLANAISFTAPQNTSFLFRRVLVTLITRINLLGVIRD